MRKLMTGDEAIARGAYEAGVSYASAYPGTPSTEILENLSTYEDIYAEWAPNEKVAMESAIGAPGVPGGTVMASLGLITGVLGFDETGTALMLTIFALQDSFGTACNVTGDGALTLMLTGYAKKHHVEKQTISVDL